jgi:hypothetical protein
MSSAPNDLKRITRFLLSVADLNADLDYGRAFAVVGTIALTSSVVAVQDLRPVEDYAKR